MESMEAWRFIVMALMVVMSVFLFSLPGILEGITHLISVLDKVQ
ncbi:hypothetical protein JGUZn3_22240 [Entomobacter blattae]|uniref:Uncharacterized protein n=1 Tax=Entomobacter blattae TaxID=2762277 RepID=A0A7H1NUG5_9PROT|nr:hypothetical protein JGUZn3_22240 [Entomobacter blattae]